MSLKEFLKRDYKEMRSNKLRIIIFICLIFINLIIPGFFYGFERLIFVVFYAGGRLMGPLGLLISLIFWPGILLSGFLFRSFGFGPVIIIGLILNIFYLYYLSCFIVYFYKKIKSKNNN